ncbi:18233_t:CDS:2, partial [Racocetra persica]
MREEQLNSEIFNSDIKHHRAVIYSELDFMLKEFVLIYQNKMILSDALLVEKAKKEVIAKTIHNCWRYTKIFSADINTNLQNLSDDMDLELDKLDDFANTLEALYPYLTYPIQVKEFLSIPNEDIVYEVPDDDQVTTDLVNTF